tara:strand:- start:302 stop:1030 length:729 start_codon:yes stop_codon:yes gene_type:complete
MKKIILSFFIITHLLASDFGVEIGLIGQLPQDEFKDEGVSNGLGFDLSGFWNPNPNIGLGLNLGGTQYGSSKRQIPFSYFSSAVTITEKTTNDIFYGHLLFRIRPFTGNVKPYLETLIGLKNLSTTTELLNENCVDSSETEYDDCEIASSKNASDNAFSYGAGGGLNVKITSIGGEEESDINGILSFFLNVRYMMGAEAEYLKEGSITFSDPSDGPVQTTFSPSKSKTDVMQISIGLHFEIE